MTQEGAECSAPSLHIMVQKLLENKVRRKIELFMVLFLLIGAIVVSWKLSDLTSDVAKKGGSSKKEEIVIVVDPGHG